jgi:hypothetical protein
MAFEGAAGKADPRRKRAGLLVPGPALRKGILGPHSTRGRISPKSDKGKRLPRILETGTGRGSIYSYIRFRFHAATAIKHLHEFPIDAGS